MSWRLIAAAAALVALAAAVAYGRLLRSHRALLHAGTSFEDEVSRRTAAHVGLLEHAEELFRGAFENAPYGMALVSLAGRFMRVNRALCELTGYTPAQFEALTVAEITHPDELERDKASMLRLAAGDLKMLSVDKRYLRADGSYVWTQRHATLLRDADGEPLHFIAQIHDITARKRADEQLRRSSRHFDLARDLTVTSGFDGYFKSVNPALEYILGWSPEEFLARPFIDMVHPDDRAGTLQEVAKLEAGEFTLNFVNRYEAKDGTYRWLDWHAIVPPDEPLMYASARDISDRVLMEAALETSERQTRQILETAHDAFVATDERGLITDWNPQAQAMFGWSREEVLGRGMAVTIFAERHRDEVRSGLRCFLGTGADPLIDNLLELTAQHRSGREFPVGLTISPLCTDGHCSFNAFLRDISERKRSEADLRLAHERAVEASRLKSEFVANMSHEIRTPLNGVIGMSGLLLTTELGDEQREYADAVSASAEALMAVIDDILDFSKIEAGKLELENESFSLRGVVEGVTSIVAAAAQAKGVELMSWVDDTLPEAVFGDGNRVRQVLANLMTNAVKFTAAGEVSIHVTGAPYAAGKVRLRFEVDDTGIGIEADALERVFESFAQADGSTTRRYGGTGLGLAISKRLVGLMGGELGVESTPAEGSTFWFSVPVEVAQIEAAPQDDAELWGVRVLVVDDNATNRTILERQLASWGMTCESAPDAETALRMLREAAQQGLPYSLAVLDAMMPGTSGIELAAAIKAQPSLRSVRMLMLTSAGNAREAAMQAGVDGIVTKPVRKARLHEEIVRALAPGRPDRLVEAEPPRVSARAPSPPATGRRVLVAEDNPVNQIVAARLLEQRGFAVEVAADGREALEMYERGGYEAIFMDCQMPELDGYEATAEIRRREGAAHHTPIIAMTANTMKGDEQRCLAAGMDDYVGKPVRPDILDEVIARVLAAAGDPRPGEDPRTDAPSRQPDGAPAQAPLVDGSMLEDVCGGDEQAREELLTLFLDQSRTSVQALAQAAAAGDADALQRVAHGLKGSSSVVGALRLAEISGRMCDAARAGALSDAHRLHADLEQSLALTSTAFERPLRPQESS